MTRPQSSNSAVRSHCTRRFTMSCNRGTPCDAVATWLTQRIVFVLFTVVLCRLPNSKGEIRCYCNIPVCVTTGYMCKSSQGVCFSEQFSYSKDLSQSRHGCVELLQQEHQREMCQDQTTTGRVTVGVYPTLLCCSEDMCNYVNKLDINIQVNSKSNASHAPGIHGGSSSSGDGSLYYTTSTGHDGALQQDLWFKAAVIAVPIAGGFILMLLIVLAVRLLRQDAKRQRHLSELRRQRYFRAIKSHNLDKKSSTDPGGTPSNCATNFAFSTNSSSPGSGSVDKHFVYDAKSCNINNNLLYSSIMSWGKWNSSPKPSTLL